jgi:hypothetical protein
LFSTGYYMAWFFGLALLIFIPIALLFAWPEVLAWWRERPAHVIMLGFVASLGFVAALSIFAVIYVPVLEMGVRRSFEEYLLYAPKANDIINVGNANLVWAKFIRATGLISDDQLNNREVSIALTPTVQILLVASAIIAFRPRFWPANDLARLSRAFVIASASVCVLFYLVTIKVGNFSLFHVLYAIVPGANAIRAGYRAMVVANLFGATAMALAFDRLLHPSLSEQRSLTRIA